MGWDETDKKVSLESFFKAHASSLAPYAHKKKWRMRAEKGGEEVVYDTNCPRIGSLAKVSFRVGWAIAQVTPTTAQLWTSDDVIWQSGAL